MNNHIINYQLVGWRDNSGVKSRGGGRGNVGVARVSGADK